MELLGHRSAAHYRAALKHLHLEPGAGEVSGAGQAVVPGADDDRVVARTGSRYSTVTLLARLRGLSTSVPRASAVW